MDVRLTWTDCDEAGDYVVPNVFSPRDLVSRPDDMDETVTTTLLWYINIFKQPLDQNLLAKDITWIGKYMFYFGYLGHQDDNHTQVRWPFGKFVAWHNNCTMR